MTRYSIISIIEEIAQTSGAFDHLEQKVELLSSNAIGPSMLQCGVIPEQFAHDSSHEKLWAKYCDILLKRWFNSLDIPSEVIRVRGDSADVRGVSKDYSIVADAKAFRLSRTAKNQKDFKITALDDWRRSDTYACLVAPWYQFPSRSSQIYVQAEQRNVTLLSYVHMKYLLDHPPIQSLELLWNTAGYLEPSKDARRYWEAVDDNIVSITETSFQMLRQYKQTAIQSTSEAAQEGIVYWESVKRSYHSLSKEEAIRRLIRSEKIDQKIDVIRKTIQRASQTLND
ncbi:MAG: HindIII family type II restriction endonuclease [Chloroflexi bacterium]|nr:HindIII family type II restriction endonuclease [Chloroflexota bacterium]MCY4247652.1 HindIII family type II restriction endonuclease [Chloroflexota bacterium]